MLLRKDAQLIGVLDGLTKGTNSIGFVNYNIGSSLLHPGLSDHQVT